MAGVPFFPNYLPPLPPLPPSYVLPPPSYVIADAAMSNANMDQAAGRAGYAIGITIGVLILITGILLVSYFCTRPANPPSDRSLRRPPSADPPMSGDIEAGLTEATLMSYPKLLYSKAKLRYKDTTATCCSICLADYKNDDVLRLLPECEHLFHLKCVDPWLHLHPTCPVCRTSPLPTPLPTPLAELAPLAAIRPVYREGR